MKRLKRLIPLIVSAYYRIVKSLLGQPSEHKIVGSLKESPKRRRSDTEPLQVLSPLWNFRSSILDRLDEYFVCLRRLRRYDPDSYDLFSRTGFTISADTFFNGSHPENRAKICDSANRWSFGGFLFPANKESSTPGKMLPSFVYFRKLNRPSVAERFKGDVYSLTLLYDDRDFSQHWRSRFSVPAVCHIGIDALGSMRLLRERTPTTSWIQPNRKRGRRPEGFKLRQHSWQYPAWLFHIASARGEPAETFAINLLVMALVTHTESLQKIIVRVNRDGLVGAFGIELPRAKYFFKDRDATALARDGKRKRIFHSVVRHDRKVKRGITSVRFHYRGLRHFGWNSYGINIVFPENNRIVAFPVPMSNAEDINPAHQDKWLSSKEAGKMVSEALAS